MHLLVLGSQKLYTAKGKIDPRLIRRQCALPIDVLEYLVSMAVGHWQSLRLSVYDIILYRLYILSYPL